VRDEALEVGNVEVSSMILTENRDQTLIPADDLVQERLRWKQLEFIAANLRVSIAASVFNATIFLVLLYEYLPRLELGLWYGAMILSCVPRVSALPCSTKIGSVFPCGNGPGFLSAEPLLPV
jgi:hypothetical protein